MAFPKNHFTPWRGHKRRLFHTITSEDFVHWSKPVLSWKTDQRDDAGSLARVERVRPLLGVPDDKIVRILLPIGVPEKEVRGPEKMAFSERAWFNRYGN